MIKREDSDWGVRLTATPLKRQPEMTIQAEIQKPPANQRTEIFIHFRGGVHMRRTDVRIWTSAMAAVLAQAEEVAEEFAPPKKRGIKKGTRKKKTPKKTSKKR